MSQDKVSLLGDSAAGVSTVQDNRTYDAVQEIPSIHNIQQPPVRPRRLPQYVAAVTATLSALAAGAVLGWTSPILSDLKHGRYHNISVDSDQMGWIGSFVTLGGMTMCIPAGFLCDLIGRKRTLLALLLPFTVGWTLILTAHSVLALYLGRLVTGMAVGASCVAAPLYCGEVAEREIRGAVGSYFQLMITVGIFLAYLAGKFLAPLPYTAFCACLPLLFAVLFAPQPETPAHCLRRGQYGEALASLIHLRGPGHDSDAELAEIEGALKERLQGAHSLAHALRRKATRRALGIAFALMFFQQLSGINAVILYTSDIFAAAGAKLDANTAAIVVGGFQAGATFLSSLAIDRLGRRVLLLVSALVMAISSAALAVFFTLKYRVSVDAATLAEVGFVPIVSLCLFVVVFSVGLGPIPWMISSEIFTAEMKSVASSAAGTFNWFLAFLVTKFYLQLSEAVGQDTTFYGFAATSLAGVAFVYFAVPETRGKTVEEVQAELEN